MSVWTKPFVASGAHGAALAQGAGEVVGAVVEALGGFYDAVETLLAEPPRRSELHIVHAFARG